MAPIIAVTGQLCSGKTTFVRRLGHLANIPWLQIDTLQGDWERFEYLATRYPGLVITESVALPIWRDVLIYCHCDERVRQERLDDRSPDLPREPLEKYDHSQKADLLVDTTRQLSLAPALELIRSIGTTT